MSQKIDWDKVVKSLDADYKRCHEQALIHKSPNQVSMYAIAGAMCKFISNAIKEGMTDEKDKATELPES